MSSDPRDKRLKLFTLEDDGEGRNNYSEYAVKNKSNLVDWELWKYIEENAPIIPTLVKQKEREVRTQENNSTLITLRVYIRGSRGLSS